MFCVQNSLHTYWIKLVNCVFQIICILFNKFFLSLFFSVTSTPNVGLELTTPEIKSLMLFQLSQPGMPLDNMLFFLFSLIFVSFPKVDVRDRCVKIHLPYAFLKSDFPCVLFFFLPICHSYVIRYSVYEYCVFLVGWTFCQREIYLFNPYKECLNSSFI